MFDGLDCRLWTYPDLTNIAARNADELWCIRVNRKHDTLGCNDIALDLLPIRYKAAPCPTPPPAKRMEASDEDRLRIASSFYKAETYDRSRNEVLSDERAAEVGGKVSPSLDVSLVLHNFLSGSSRSVAHFVTPGLSKFEAKWNVVNPKLWDEFNALGMVMGSFILRCSQGRSLRRKIATNISYYNNHVVMANNEGKTDILWHLPTRWRSPVGSGAQYIAYSATHAPEGWMPLVYADPELIDKAVRRNMEFFTC